MSEPQQQEGPPVPWTGEMQRADKIIVAGIVASVVYGLVSLLIFPLLSKAHPALLEALRGNAPAIVNMGARARIGEASFVAAVVLAVPSVMLFDWAFWWAGRRWGDRVFAWLLGGTMDARAQRRLKRLHWVERRFGALAVVLASVLPVPAPLIYAAVGDGGMRLPVFLVLDVLGTLLWTGLLATLGYEIGRSAVDVVDAINAYALKATLALIVLIFVYQYVKLRRATR